MFCTTDAPRCEKHQCLAVQSHRRFPLMVRCQRPQVCNNCFRVFVVEAVGWHRWATWQSLYPSPVIKVAGPMSFEKPMQQTVTPFLWRKATRHHVRLRGGCSVLRSLRTRTRSRNNMHENSGDPKGPKLAAPFISPPIVYDPPSETFLRAFA